MRLIRLLLVCGLVHSLCLYTPVEAQLLPGNQFQQLPEVQAWIVGEDLTIDASGRATFHIAVEVPQDHHGYLDPGDEGLLIPFSFSFTALEERGGT
jgi:hypothetical protein